MSKLTLFGNEYVPEQKLKGGKVDWDDVPASLRATEQMVRESNGASDPTWLRRHLTWRGCRAAIEFRKPYWLPCPNEPRDSGYCGRHKKREEARHAEGWVTVAELLTAMNGASE